MWYWLSINICQFLNLTCSLSNTPLFCVKTCSCCCFDNSKLDNCNISYHFTINCQFKQSMLSSWVLHRSHIHNPNLCYHCTINCYRQVKRSRAQFYYLLDFLLIYFFKKMLVNIVIYVYPFCRYIRISQYLSKKISSTCWI